MAATQNIDTVEFPCEPWVLRGEDSMQPVPATWTLLPMKWQEKGIKGAISCARCGQATLIPRNMGIQYDKGDGRVLPEYRCKCGFVCRAILKDWDRRKLYCIAYEVADRAGKIHLQKEYLHAESDVEANAYFLAGHADVIRIVSTAPVVGFYQKDKDGKELIV